MLCLEQDVGGVVGEDVLTLWQKKCFMIGGRDRDNSEILEIESRGHGIYPHL